MPINIDKWKLEEIIERDKKKHPLPQYFYSAEEVDYKIIIMQNMINNLGKLAFEEKPNSICERMIGKIDELMNLLMVYYFGAKKENEKGAN
jgi:hypothetical protein